MTLQLAYQTVQQTLEIVSPEILLLAVAIAMMTASPFVQLPKEKWAAIAAIGLIAAAGGPDGLAAAFTPICTRRRRSTTPWRSTGGCSCC